MQEEFEYPELEYKTSDESIEKAGAWLKYTDPKEIVDSLENDLKGLERTPDGKLVRKYKPYMNDEGVSAIMKPVRSIIHKSTNISNYDEKTINEILLDLVQNLAREITFNWREFGLDKLQASTIIFMCVTAARSVLNQARMSKAGTPLQLLKALVTSYQTKENINVSSNQDKRRQLGIFK